MIGFNASDPRTWEPCSDTEGYSCAKDSWSGSWIIVDRYDRHQADHPSFEDSRTARDYADRMNDNVIAARFGREKIPVAAVKASKKRKPAVKKSKTVVLPSFDAALDSLSLF